MSDVIVVAAIEAALKSDARVASCAVLKQANARNKAFVTLRRPDAATDASFVTRVEAKEQLWGSIFDAAYAKRAVSADPALNSSGWVDSLTGHDIPEDQMTRIVDQTLTRIMSLRPRRVLEIGCGTGMLLLRLRSCCERVVGMDVSERGLENIREALRKTEGDNNNNGNNVELHHRSALNFDGFADGEFDVVVLNSTVQYFPSIAYLAEVLGRARRVVAKGGAIFLGDLRSLPLLGAFAAAVCAARSTDDDTRTTIEKRYHHDLAHERELLVDPVIAIALLRDIPDLTHATILVKRGRDANELTLFRFDLVLTVGGDAAAESRGVEWIDARAKPQKLKDLHALLARDGSLAVRGIHNARLTAPLLAQEWVESHSLGGGDRAADLRAHVTQGSALSTNNEPQIDPEDLFALADESTHDVVVGWSSIDPSRGDLSVLITPRARNNALLAIRGLHPTPPDAALWPLARFASAPTKDLFAKTALAELTTRIRAIDEGAHVVELACLPHDAQGNVNHTVLAELADRV